MEADKLNARPRPCASPNTRAAHPARTSDLTRVENASREVQSVYLVRRVSARQSQKTEDQVSWLLNCGRRSHKTDYVCVPTSMSNLNSNPHRPLIHVKIDVLQLIRTEHMGYDLAGKRHAICLLTGVLPALS